MRLSSRDFLEFDDFIAQCYNGILEIAAECTGIAAIVGSPSVNPSEEASRYITLLIFFVMAGSMEKLIKPFSRIMMFLTNTGILSRTASPMTLLNTKAGR